jgi:hypothetical protein
LTLSFLPLFTPQGEEEPKVDLITSGHSFNQPCLHNETSIKIPKQQGSGTFRVGKHMKVVEGCILREDMDAP